SASPPPGVNWTQVYAVMAHDNGSEYVGTWSHFDYGSQKPPADYVYEYDLDPSSGMEQTQQLGGAAALQLERQLCAGQNAVRGLARGQDSAYCRELESSDGRRPRAGPSRK
ncbi:MAG TPA: hypothetical protein VGS41_04875, partial [Chthonomonadales bacterium]|nr:hypothetical protein [Chthonomonadales bacterium]